MGPWKSDHRIVPMKPGNSGGGKAVRPSRRVPRGTGRTQRRSTGDHRGACTWALPGKVVAGSRMREMRLSGSERGQGTIVTWRGSVNNGWGASLTNTQGPSGGSPARPAKKSGSTRCLPATRGPALLALTKPAQATELRR
jgi:hypothetical protein